MSFHESTAEPHLVQFQRTVGKLLQASQMEGNHSSSSSGSVEEGEAATVVGYVAIPVTVIFFLSTVQLIARVFQRRSAEGMNVHNFVGMMLNCALWVMYGVRSQHLPVWTTNGVGVVVSLFGFVAHIAFSETSSERRYNVLVATLASAIGLGGGAAVAFSLDVHTGQEVIGYLAMGANIFLYGAPLTLLARIVKDGDVRSLSGFAMCMGLATSVVWTTYAVLIKNFFIGVPNGIGIGLFATQITLFLCYRGTNLSPNQSLNEVAPLKS